MKTLNKALKTTVLIIYHKSDFDGLCSRSIAYDFYKQKSTYNIELLPIERGDEFNIQMCKDKIVVVVDFSFKPTVMNKIKLLAKEYIWIDHHISAIEEATKSGVLKDGKIKTSLNPKVSACYQCYKYFVDDKVPLPVRLISDWDSSVIDYDSDSDQCRFHYGLESYKTDVDDRIWSRLLTPDYDKELVANIMTKGRLIIKYEKKCYEHMINQFGSMKTFYVGDTPITDKAFVINIDRASRVFQEMVTVDYDIMFTYIMQPNGKYKISVYSKLYDCSEIAVKLGNGGGHKFAAGYRSAILPFK